MLGVNTKAYKRAFQSLMFRLCLSALIIVAGCLYPAMRIWRDPDLRNNPDSGGAVVPPFALCLGLVYGGLACWRFYCKREDLHYDHAHNQSFPDE
jgi:hypothetical protein